MGGEFPRFGDVKAELKNYSPLAFKGLLLLYRMNVLVTFVQRGFVWLDKENLGCVQVLNPTLLLSAGPHLNILKPTISVNR